MKGPQNKMLRITVDNVEILCIDLLPTEKAWLLGHSPAHPTPDNRGRSVAALYEMACFLGSAARDVKASASERLAKSLRVLDRPSEQSTQFAEAHGRFPDPHALDGVLPPHLVHAVALHPQPSEWPACVQLGALHISALLTAWWHVAQAVHVLAHEVPELGASTAMHEWHSRLVPVRNDLDAMAFGLASESTASDAPEWASAVVATWYHVLEERGRPMAISANDAQARVPASRCEACEVRNHPSAALHGLTPFAPDCRACMIAWAQHAQETL